MKRILAACVLSSTIVLTESSAQASTAWTASVRGSLLIPAGSLADLFRPGTGFAATVGQRTSSDMIWEGVVDVARFSKPNDKRLFHDSLSLGLEWIGAGVQGTYLPFGGEGVMDGRLHPFLTGSAVMTRWRYDRGGLSADSTGTIVLPPFRQQDWSLCLSFGAGCEVAVFERISLHASASYRLIIGEIWPTLALRVEGASGFQLVDASAGLRVWF